MKYVFLCIGMMSVVWPLHSTLAATGGGTYTITQQIGNDSIPPTIPTNLQATPVSSSQIHLTWGPSTDNQVLVGYKVYRDGVQIATTPQTLFDDTGLMASTTYTYAVKAYDSFNNVSTSSNVAATTTLPVPVVATSTATTTAASGTHHTGGQLFVQLDTLQTTLATSSATFIWTTSGFAASELRWGTGAYDLGYIQDQDLRRQHLTTITGLEPGRTYSYQLTGITATGRAFILKQGTFTTLGWTAVASPLNVSALQATVMGDTVHLTWRNPDGVAISKIRVVRSFLFYPVDPSDGAVVYEGMGTSYDDRGALTDQVRQFYAVFVYDEHGNVSSGAVVAAYRPGTTPVPIVIGQPLSSSTATTSGTSGASSAITTQFGDFFIVQNNTVVHPANDIFHITDELPILVQVPYSMVPEHLKSIVMTIDGNYSYVLRVSKDAQYYEAYIPGITIGSHTIEFAIYDFQTSVLKRVAGTILVRATPVTAAVVPSGRWSFLVTHPFLVSSIAVAGLMLIFLLLVLWRFDVRRRS